MQGVPLNLGDRCWSPIILASQLSPLGPSSQTLQGGLASGYIKLDAPCRGESIVTYDRLFDMEHNNKGQRAECRYFLNATPCFPSLPPLPARRSPFSHLR